MELLLKHPDIILATNNDTVILLFNLFAIYVNYLIIQIDQFSLACQNCNMEIIKWFLFRNWNLDIQVNVYC